MASHSWVMGSEGGGVAVPPFTCSQGYAVALRVQCFAGPRFGSLSTMAEVSQVVYDGQSIACRTLDGRLRWLSTPGRSAHVAEGAVVAQDDEESSILPMSASLDALAAADMDHFVDWMEFVEAIELSPDSVILETLEWGSVEVRRNPVHNFIQSAKLIESGKLLISVTNSLEVPVTATIFAPVLTQTPYF